jgi:hypothetical protein
VARMSDPHAEMSTAGVIIADRTEIASGKFVMLLQTTAETADRIGRLLQES